MMESNNHIDAEMQEALAELEDAGTRVYYDADKDGQDRQSYYHELLATLDKKSISFEVLSTDNKKISITVEEESISTSGAGISFSSVSHLIRNTHNKRLKYKPSRYIYPWVDLHPDRKIHSIYSGQIFDAEEFIRDDFNISLERATRLGALMTSESAVSNEMLEMEFDSLEAALPYNCEHVVPQSWFNKREPMRGDIHHLFGCESRCNSFRSNIPYFDFPDFNFPDFEDAVRDSCGKREENKFEPESGKGPAARAVFYFLLRYPGEINSTSREFEAQRLPILLKWHEDHPVNEYELHRNMAVFNLQGNRNPFIDFPEWAKLIDLTQGLGD